MSMSIQASRARYQGTMPGGAPVGDPGLFGFFKGVGKAALATVTGGPLAGVRSAATSIVSSFQPSRATPTQRAEALGFTGSRRASFLSLPSVAQTALFDNVGQAFQGPTQVPRPGVKAFFERGIPGGASGMMGGPADSAQPAGYHANKSSYFLQDGTFIPKGSIWVKNRRRNPLNPRALSSSMARITSFKGAASKAGLITIRSPGCKKKSR